MSVLIYIDHADGHIKKASFEALSYGVALAKQLDTTAEAILLGSVTDNLADSGKYGIKKLYHSTAFDHLDGQPIVKALQEVIKASSADIIVFPNTTGGKNIAPQLSAVLKAGLVSGAVALPDISNGFKVKKAVFSGKAFANVSVLTDKKIISVNPNAFAAQEISSDSATIETLDILPAATKIKVISVNKLAGEVPLSEAEIVVSGGRGLKGPENWNLIEDLAKLLGAATACSRPVSDSDWRPHHEHVGQTGLAISPNLYIAIGISGAIQHLAGVNRSKVIVVINKDPEAPFFKAADYGIVGDAFEVVPKLIEAIKKLRGAA